MPIPVVCGGCNKRYAVPDGAAGKRVKCKNCGAAITVPAAGGGAARVTPRTAPPPPPDLADEAFGSMADLERVAAAPPPLPRVPPPVRSPAAAPAGYAPPPAAAYFPKAPPRRPADAPNHGPWLVLLFLLSNIAVLVLSLTYGDTHLSKYIIIALVVSVVGFFLLVGPVVLLGVWIGSKVMGYQLQDLAYLRACGPAAIPGIALSLLVSLRILAPEINPVPVLALCFAVVLPAFFYVLKSSFGLTPPEALVSFVFCGVLYLFGQGTNSTLTKMTTAGVQVADLKSKFAAGGDAGTVRSLTQGGSSGGGSSGSSVQQVDPTESRIDYLRTNLTRLADRPAGGTSREAALTEVTTLRAEAEGLRQTLATSGRWEDFSQLLARAEEKTKALPSEKPEPSLFQPPAGAAVWPATAATAALGPEVSFRQYKIRHPAEAVLDLQASSNANGLTWRHPRTRASLSIAVIPRQNARQQRPWVATQSFMLRGAKEQNLFAVDAPNSKAEVGRVNGLTFTRVAPDPSAASSAWRSVKYVALDGNDWLVLDVQLPPGDTQAGELLEASARTVRKAGAAEPKADPFAPDLIASRLGDDPERAAAILRGQGAAAEPAVAGQLASTDLRTRRAAAKLMADIATAGSVPALRQAAESSDTEVAQTARAALRRVAPDQFDGVSEALLELKQQSPFKKKDAYAALAAATPDPKRRAEVAGVLEQLLIDDRTGWDGEAIAKALAVWYTDKTASRLAPLMDKKTFMSAGKRQAVIAALGATKDKRAVPLIMYPWLIEEKAHVVPALVTIGQPAEDEILRMKLMWNADAKVRTASAEVLEQIGTAKSLVDLQRASKDPRDAFAAAAATRALDAVKERVAAAKATSPATRPAAATTRPAVPPPAPRGAATPRPAR